MTKAVAVFVRNEKILTVEVELGGWETAREVFKKAQQLSVETEGAQPAAILVRNPNQKKRKERMVWYDAHVL